MLTLQQQALSRNLPVCHRCPRRQSACRGPCACLEDGRDVLNHAEAGDCPLARFPAQPSRGLGDTVAKVAKAIGVEAVVQAVEHVTGKRCGCKGRRERLNERVPYRGGL